MVYLTYTQQFQNDVMECKDYGMSVNDLKELYQISTYTLYKILHLNNKLPIPSEASEGKGFEERVEHREMSPNNNFLHERPASTWNYSSDRHIKIEHKCLQCNNIFYARDRKNRTKFCSKMCQGIYLTNNNSTKLICDNCGNEFIVKNSAVDSFIHCEKCRELNLGRQSSKMSRKIGQWLNEEFNEVISEKQFDWFYNVKKPQGRFKLDYWLPEYNLAIEYDGEQHFKPSFVGLWESVDKVQERDKIKDKLCKQKNITILRIRYDESITKKKLLMKIYAELQGKLTCRSER